MDLKFKDNSKLRLNESCSIYSDYGNINTNIPYSRNLKIISEIYNNNTTVGAIFQSGNKWGSQFGEMCLFVLSGGKVRVRGLGAYDSDYQVSVGWHIIEMCKDYVKIDGSTVSNGNDGGAENYPIYIGRVLDGPSSIGIIKNIKIFNNDVLIADYIGVKYNNQFRIKDNVSGNTLQMTNGSLKLFKYNIILPNNTLLKTTTLYHKNTPNIDGSEFLNSIFNAQETAEDVVLNRIRVDIGNVSGSITELMRYSILAGFNDAGEEQTKPRLVGTWTVNDWYTQEQLTAAQSAFDGLTIVSDPNYVIDFSQLAVQTLDDTQPNYNPAVAIILQGAGYGKTFDTPLYTGQSGRWMITKNQASSITDGDNIIKNVFAGITNVTDVNTIVSSNAQNYSFSSFLELRYFTGITALPSFAHCTSLTSLNIPTSVTTLGKNCLYHTGISGTFVIPAQITTMQGTFSPGAEDAHCLITKIVFEGNNITTIGNWTFGGVFSITETLVIPDSVTNLGAYALYNARFSAPLVISSNASYIGYTLGNAGGGWVPIFQYVWLRQSTPPTFIRYSGSYKIYVGDGSSAAHDDAILQVYLADTNWAPLSSRLDTWYNYLHPTT